MTVTGDKNEKQVVSKQRVADHGEVYTAKREVNAMLDLVKEETERMCDKGLVPVIHFERYVGTARREYPMCWHCSQSPERGLVGVHITDSEPK